MSILKITKDNYEQEVLQSDKPVLLDFWAEWCAPCRMAAPILEQIAEDTKDTSKIGKVNIEEEPELIQIFKITGVPTFAVIKNGEVVQKAVGLLDREELLDMLQ